MSCDWEDRISLCQLDARKTITVAERGEDKVYNLCDECTDQLWEMLTSKLRQGTVEWRQTQISKKNG